MSCEWISIKDKTPSNDYYNKKYLVFIEFGHKSYIDFLSWRVSWQKFERNDCFGTITHWMETPKFPEKTQQ